MHGFKFFFNSVTYDYANFNPSSILNIAVAKLLCLCVGFLLHFIRLYAYTKVLFFETRNKEQFTF